MKFDEYMIMNVANGFMGTYVLYTACRLKVFDALADGRKNLQELEDVIQVKGQLLIRILRPLVAYKILSFDENEDYALESAGRMLISYEEDSLWTYILFCGKESMQIWENIYPAMLQNCAPKDFLAETEIFETQKKDEKKFELFDGMMKRVSKSVELASFFEKYGNQDKAYRIVDVGGGTGTIMLKFLHNFKNGSGTIVDLEAAKQDALTNIANRGWQERCTFKSGNFFEPLELTGNLYILSRVLHDWEDEKAKLILQNVVECMDEKSELIILEGLMPENVNEGRIEMYMNDIQMWGFCGGKERTKAEFADLLASVGLNMKHVYQLTNNDTLSAIVADKTKVEEWVF